MSFVENIRRMRKEGKPWSEVADWIGRQVGYDKEIEVKARKVFYEEEAVTEVQETKLPEGVELVKYEFTNTDSIEVADNLFSMIIAKKCEFRSAVNLGTKVRTVMYEYDERGIVKGGGSALIMETVSKDTAWHLQQMIDWAYRQIVEIIAVRKMDKAVEVVFIMKGLKAIPKEEKEKMWYHFKKVDGWKLVGEPKDVR